MSIYISPGERPGTDPAFIALRRDQHYSHLDLELLVSRTGGQCICGVSVPSIWGNTGLYPGPPNTWIGGEWVYFHSFHILALPPNDLGKEAVVGG